ncbi:ABC-2 family transporter [Microbacterium sp. AG157]|uniref:ABC transporter permease n=1 Tax=Microbacterium TaxID=33882 RepID=UPI000E360EE7|nr:MULTISPECIES: ABC transporter permease [Microbacterium]REC99668.1 ABC-2 family transporter [Microbacterium sp. AG157]WJS91626.1 ABC transporter permease [Microbacterium testaceum]
MLTTRNLRVFFRDRVGVFFSLLSALILIALYALFLGGIQVDSLEARFPTAPDADVRWFVNSWVFAGITMITTLTTSIAALGVFVDDNVSGRFRDFIVSPIRRTHLILGYMIAGFTVSVVMTSIIIAIGQVYLLTQGDELLSPANAGETWGAVLLSSAAFSALAAFAVTFLRSAGAFTALSTVVGSLIGFFSGAYVPAGTLPTSVVDGINLLPFAQAAMLIRRPYTEQALVALVGGQEETARALREFYGMSASVGGFAVSAGVAVGTLVMVAVVFACLGAWRLSRTIR